MTAPRGQSDANHIPSGDHGEQISLKAEHNMKVFDGIYCAVLWEIASAMNCEQSMLLVAKQGHNNSTAREGKSDEIDININSGISADLKYNGSLA